MNRLKKKARRAAARGCHAFRRGTWPTYRDAPERWDVYVEQEGAYGPRGLKLTHRQAVNLAYAASIARPVRLTVTFD